MTGIRINIIKVNQCQRNMFREKNRLVSNIQKDE